jgi:cell division protein FtsB
MQKMQKKIQTLIQKTKNSAVTDTRVLSLLVLGIVGVSVVWSGVRVVEKNYTLLQKIARLEQQNSILELENKNKQLQNEYFKTVEYAELKARRVEGKASPGERVYTLSNDTATAALKTPESSNDTRQDDSKKPKYQQNFEGWMDFFFGN